MEENDEIGLEVKDWAADRGRLVVRRVRGAGDRRRFVLFPYSLHRDNPHWIAPLIMAQKDILNVEKHPFYKTADVEMFLAEREGRTVGRIMAILNHAHNEFHQERAGFFGFFEVENDEAAARVLFEEAGKWLKERGAEFMRGPFNPSTNYECAMLVEGFDQDPKVMMPYNPEYYPELVERCGLTGVQDVFAYDVRTDQFSVDERARRAIERIRSREKITIRTVKLKNFKSEVDKVREVYNNAWSRNWSFVPVSEDEFEHLGKDLKQIVDPEVVFIAEKQVEGLAEPRPVGFFLAVPDINQALRRLRGRLLPFGILKLLWYSRRIDQIRIITMGVVKEYQNSGIAALFYEEILKAAKKRGYKGGEMSWILENNVMMNRSAEMLGGRLFKRYRIYEKSL